MAGGNAGNRYDGVTTPRASTATSGAERAQQATNNNYAKGYSNFYYVPGYQYGNRSSPPPPPPPPPAKSPPKPSPRPSPPPPPPPPPTQTIKIATAELFISGETILDEDQMVSRTFQEIGGTELLEVTRTDSVAGTDQAYQPIVGMSTMNVSNAPMNIMSVQDTDSSYFNQFPIVLEKYLAPIGTGPFYSTVYVDKDSSSSTYGDLIINTQFLRSNERLEVQFLAFDSLLNATII